MSFISPLLYFLETKEKIDHDITGQTSDSQAHDLYVRGRSKQKGNNRDRPKSRSKPRSRSIVCWHYKEPGHARKNCDKLHRKKNTRQDRYEDAGKAIVVEVGGNVDVLLVTEKPIKLNDEWILDTGCSYHVSESGLVFIIRVY